MTPHVPRSARLAAAAVVLASALVATPRATLADAPEAPWGDVAIIDRRDVANETRVVGGARASIVDWPSVVALLHPGELQVPFHRQFCGGTVIAPRWVLTAAHCLYDLFGSPMGPGSLTVLVGQTDLRDPSEGRELVVTNVIRHPGYVNDDTGRTRDDIALLELAVPIPAPASELFAGGPEDYPGRLGAIVGWGATEYVTIGDPSFPDELRVATVPLVPLAACNAPDAYGGDVVAGQFCAGYAEGGVDSCTGDSGGPLYLSVDDRVQLAGVTSFGRGCALPGYYGIYTDVGDYLDWIRGYVELTIEPVPPLVTASVPPGSATRGPQAGGAAGGTDDGGTGSGAFGAVGLGLLAVVAGRRRRRGPGGGPGRGFASDERGDPVGGGRG